MIITPRAPAIHTRSKVLCSDLDEARAIDAALRVATYNDFLVPIAYGGRVVAWCRGEPYPSRVVHWRPRRGWERETLWAGFTGMDDLIDETTNNGKLLRQPWFKRFNGAMPTLTWTHMAGIGGWPTYEAFAGTARTARQFDESSKPAIAHGGNKSPDTKHLLSLTGMTGANVTAGNVLLLYDLVLSYDRCTLTNANQAMTNVLTAQRWAAAGQPGLRIMGLISTVMASASTFTLLTYVTPGGATHTIPNPTDTGVVGGATLTGDTCPYGAWWTQPTGTPQSQLCVQLAAGDSGVASISDYTMSATPASGEIAYLLAMPLAWIPLNVAAAASWHTLDLVKMLPQLGRVYDGACLTFAMYSVATHTFLGGDLVVGWG